ncbi:MAG: hypothetical protein ACPGJE_02635 [Wenzhouxiangellaceae bacterium]
MNSNAPHLLLFGWYRKGTGFTRVLEALLPHLAKHFRVTWMGIGYQGEPRQLAPSINLLPTNLNGGDLVGAWQARLDWENLKPDCVLALNDPWWLEHYPRELDQVRGKVPLVGYLPLDGDIPDPEIARGLEGFSLLMTYTEHAASQLQGALERCGLKIPVAVVGHGVDLSSFAPIGNDFGLEARMERARNLFTLQQPAWVVLNASRPDPRKRIDLTIEGFARFAQGKPEHVKLCLHQALAYPQFVDPLRAQVETLGIVDRVLWWPPADEVLDDAALNLLYNACAVGINTSLGEGFGLVSFEHATTGAAQLVPDHPALRELWRDAADFIAPVEPVRTSHSPLILGQVSAGAVATALEPLYRDADHYRRLASAGQTRCHAPSLRWDHCARKMLREIHQHCAAIG